jgi:hypothetical protein
MDYTLDIPEIQVLVNFPGDRDGFYWHHRILLHRIDGAVWLTLTPDHDIERLDLNVVPHRVLQRKAAFPEDILDEIYAHDAIARPALLGFKKTAHVQASILGLGDPQEAESHHWLIAESSHVGFGNPVDDEVLEDEATGMMFSEKGVVILQGEEVFVEKAMTKDIEKWRKTKGLETGDQRLLGDHRDPSGKKALVLSEAVGLMKGGEEEETDFPIVGTRAAKELHEAVSGGAGGFLAYHEQWIRLSGVGKRSSAAHIHRCLCEGLRLMYTFDQIDASTTAIGEHLSRWMVQTELAVERNPAQPDYSGLDIVAGTSLLADGRAATNKFQEWVAGKLKERSSVWKQERLFAEERRKQKGKGKGGREEDSDEDSDPRRRKKKKGKNRGQPGGDGPSASAP